MDRRRMDAEGGRVVHRERRTRKLAVVVAVQNVLVTACLAVTLYICWDVQSRTGGEQDSKNNVHIQFDPISDIWGNVTLQFVEVKSNHTMSLDVEKKDEIYVSCTGPYVLYMDLCYLNRDDHDKEATGILQLEVVGEKTPVSSFPLNASKEVCRGHHTIAFLRRNEKATLHLYSSEAFKIKKATVGLSYLLGSRCEYW